MRFSARIYRKCFLMAKGMHGDCLLAGVVDWKGSSRDVFLYIGPRPGGAH